MKLRNLFNAPMLIFVLALAVMASAARFSAKRSDTYARNRVLMLYGATGECTALEVIAPSGKQYTITAAHCRSILGHHEVARVKTEDGKQHIVRFIAEDPTSDLLLLTPIDAPAFDVAKRVYKHEHVHTMTHGNMQPSYRTDGELLAERMLDNPIALITDVNSMIDCSAPKYKIDFISGPLGFPVLVCLFHTTQVYTTAMVLHGSSGGPLLDPDNNLIGIVSTLQETGLSTFVTLKDIKKFLKDR